MNLPEPQRDPDDIEFEDHFEALVRRAQQLAEVTIENEIETAIAMY